MKKWRPIEERKKALELYYNEGYSQKEVAQEMNLSVNTIKSWIRRARSEDSKKEKANIRINDETKSIEENCEVVNKVDRKLLRPVKIEIVSKHNANIDRDAKKEIKNLQMQVALLRDFLFRKERG